MTILYAGDDLEALAHLHNYPQWILNHFRDYLRGHVLEIGAGIGTFSVRLLPLVEQLDLVEPSINLVTSLTQRFADQSQVRIFPVSIEMLLTEPRDQLLDGIVMINVLEHIKDDIAVLSGLTRHLCPSGVLLLFVPALPFLMSNLDRQLGHERRYLLTELTEKLQSAGFTIEKSRYFDLFGVLPWFLLHRLLGRTCFNPYAVETYDRFVVPIGQFIEKWITPPFGKNILIIARKK